MNQEEFAKDNIVCLLEGNHLKYSDNKSTFNYINYWNYVNSEYFPNINDKIFSNTNQIIYKILVYGKLIFHYLLLNIFSF